MPYVPEHLELWKHPSCYVGAEWPEWYVFLGQNRDSDTLTRSNFAVGLKALEPFKDWEIPEEFTDTGEVSVRAVRENHWACGWVEWIAIHQSNESALKAADEMARKLEGYPVLDETHWSELETEEADEVWKRCYNGPERLAYIRKHRSQFEFNSLSEMLAVCRGHYFNGYASELLS